MILKVYRIIFFIFILFNASLLQATVEPLKVVLHINDAHKIGHLGNSVKNIRKELGDNVVIKVVINGKAVTRLLKSNKVNAKVIQSVLKQNVPIGLCHNAVANNRVEKRFLIEGMDVLETDGNVTVINYQQQGYIYIKM